MAPGEDPTEHALKSFAGDVASVLNDARRKQETDALSIIAEPAFLGAVRKKLDERTAKLIDKTVDKDVVDADRETLRRYILPF